MQEQSQEYSTSLVTVPSAPPDPARPKPAKNAKPLLANIGRSRSAFAKGKGMVEETPLATETSSTPTVCHVCGRLGCLLVSHRTYILPQRRKQRKSTPVIPKMELMSRPTLEALHPKQILEIRTAKTDPFLALPIQGKKRDDELFQHC